MTRTRPVAAAEPGQVYYADTHYAGFWRRFVAMVIDYLLILIAAFVLVALVAAAVPTAARFVDLTSFGLLTAERTIETRLPSERTNADGSRVITTEKLVETNVAGRWTYLHRITETETVRRSEPGTRVSTKHTKRTLLDPTTQAEIRGIGFGWLVWLPWLIYATLMEASSRQATLGKMAIGIKVEREDGQPATLPRALARNLLKIVSCITLLIGFQALINAGVETGLLPTKGLTLPLVSYGGSSLLVTLLAIGILLSISRDRQGGRQAGVYGQGRSATA